MIEGEFRDKVEMFASTYGIKPGIPLAIIDYRCGGIATRSIVSPRVQNEFQLASGHTGIKKRQIEKYYVKLFGEDEIPNLKFFSEYWDTERQASNGEKLDMLMSFQYGISLERPREFLNRLELIGYSSIWKKAIIKFTTSLDVQIDYLCQRIVEVQAELLPRDNFFIVYAGKMLGYKGKVVAPTLQARELYQLAAKYGAKESETAEISLS